MQTNYVPSLDSHIDDDRFSALMADPMGQQPTERETNVQNVLDAICVRLGIRTIADDDND